MRSLPAIVCRRYARARWFVEVIVWSSSKNILNGAICAPKSRHYQEKDVATRVLVIWKSPSYLVLREVRPSGLGATYKPFL
jgi:hypothetical protein